MRGKAGKHIDEIRAVRITPAYAGKSGRLYIKSAMLQDHPRLCGEKFWVSGFSLTSVRITPAYAGKSP